MPLNRTEIKSRIKIENQHDDGFNVASYDLHARWVLKAPSKLRERREFARGKFEIPEGGFVLEPQGMVRVVSEEYLRLPDDVIGYALVKNKLSCRCVLAINIGIVDPGYQGPLSSTLINFGKEPFLITRDTTFLRLTFHSFKPEEALRTFPVLQQGEYVRTSATEVKEVASHTFLNLHTMAEQAADVAFGRYRRWVIGAATLGALFFAALAIFAPLGASVVEKRVLE